MIGKSPWLQSVFVETDAAIGDMLDVTVTQALRQQPGRRPQARRRPPDGQARTAPPLDSRIDGRARLELEFEQPYLLGPLFGDYDRHLVMIEDRLGVNIAARGNRVMIEGDPDAAARARDVLIGLYNRLDQGQDVDAAAVEALIGMANQPALDGIITDEVASPPRVMIRTRKKTIVPRSTDPDALHGSLARDDMIFALGPGGHRQDLSRGRPGGVAADHRAASTG